MGCSDERCIMPKTLPWAHNNDLSFTGITAPLKAPALLRSLQLENSNEICFTFWPPTQTALKLQYSSYKYKIQNIAYDGENRADSIMQSLTSCFDWHGCQVSSLKE